MFTKDGSGGQIAPTVCTLPEVCWGRSRKTSLGSWDDEEIPLDVEKAFHECWTSLHVRLHPAKCYISTYLLFNCFLMGLLGSSHLCKKTTRHAERISVTRNRSNTPSLNQLADHQGVELLSLYVTPKHDLWTHRSVGGLVGQMQPKIVSLGQLQVLKNCVQQDLSLIVLLESQHTQKRGLGFNMLILHP